MSRDNRHVIVEWAWELQGISPTQKFVLCSIAKHADSAGRCWPSNAAIVRDTMLSERAVRTAIKDLVEKGHMQLVLRPQRSSVFLFSHVPGLRADQMKHAPGAEELARYAAMPAPPAETEGEQERFDGAAAAPVSERIKPNGVGQQLPLHSGLMGQQLPLGGQDVPQVGQQLPQGGAGGAPEPYIEPYNEPSRELRKEDPPKSPVNGTALTLFPMQLEVTKAGVPSEAEIAVAFRAFWKAYPSTNGKAEAERNFRLAAIGKLPPLGSRSTTGHDPVPLQDMINGAVGYAEEIDRSPKDRSIKHAQGWLTERRWRDYEDGKVSGPRPKETLHGQALMRRIAEEEADDEIEMTDSRKLLSRGH